ncbi:hypothetical protein BCR34DRAFT_343452 [Clohesyomyces aquaticus]|uniref:Uncharacterized protein n=1 Tax=Clohesyomyces aquaticus TaxID=1231657 RepID=A0A1Y2A7C9_9PLEO|nr:hypothetical protein BCR34DRAFT_343452 [Clohesyomyces aquaticus]
MPLSPSEKTILEEFLPGSFVLQSQAVLDTRKTSTTDEVQSIIAALLDPSDSRLESIWKLQDTLTTMMLGSERSVPRGSDPNEVLSHLRSALKDSRSGVGSSLPTAMLQYHTERLYFAMRSTQQSSTVGESILDKQLMARLGRVIRHEYEEFRRAFPTPSNDDDVLQWVGNSTVISTQSPPSIMSEDQQPSAASSHSSPIDTKAALAPIPHQLNRNATLRVEPLRVRPGAEQRDSISPLSAGVDTQYALPESIQAACVSRVSFLRSAQDPPKPPGGDVRSNVRMIQDATAAIARDVPQRKPVAIVSPPPIVSSTHEAVRKPRDTGAAISPNSHSGQAPKLPHSPRSAPPSDPPNMPLPTLPLSKPAPGHVPEAVPKSRSKSTLTPMPLPSTSFPVGRMSIRETGHHLPVSTISPPSRHQEQNLPKPLPYESYPEVVIPPPEYVSKHSRQPSAVSGLETVPRSPTPPPKPPKREMLPWAVRQDQQPVGAADVLRPLPAASDRRRESMFSDTDNRSILSSSASTASRKKSKFFGRLMGSGRPSLEPLPPSLEFRFSICGKHLTLWCKKDPLHVVQISEPFATGRCYELVLPDSMKPSPGKQQARSIRHLASSGNVIAALVHIEDVSVITPILFFLIADSLDGFTR